MFAAICVSTKGEGVSHRLGWGRKALSARTFRTRRGRQRRVGLFPHAAYPRYFIGLLRHSYALSEIQPVEVELDNGDFSECHLSRRESTEITGWESKGLGLSSLGVGHFVVWVPCSGGGDRRSGRTVGVFPCLRPAEELSGGLCPNPFPRGKWWTKAHGGNTLGAPLGSTRHRVRHSSDT